MKCSIRLILVLFLFIASANAQPYYFRHYQAENGLSNNINCLTQDKNGFLWFSTKEGLSRFDGYRFKMFHLDPDHEQTLNRDFINCLFTDANGVLWVGSLNGLYYYDTDKEQMVRFLQPMNSIGAIDMDKTGQLWFIANRTVCRYNFSKNKLTVFPAENFFYASAICVTQNNSVWLATQDGYLQKFDSSTQSFKAFDVFAHSPPPVSRYIMKIIAVDSSALFVGTTSQGLKEFNSNSGAYTDLLSYNPDKTTIYVRDAIQNSKTEYWFATESGIFIYDIVSRKFTNLRKKFLDPYSLSDNAVYTLCKDSEEGVWAGTYFGGVNYYSKQYSAFQKFFPDNSSNSISGNAVREICEDGYGNLWIGTEDAGLNKLIKKSGAIQHFNPTGEASSIAYSNIHGLLVNGNNLWIGTFEHGLDVMDVRTGTVRKHYSVGSGPKKFRNNFIVSLLKTSSGDILIGSGRGLYKYDNKTDGFEEYGETPNYIFVSCLIEAKDKTIWIGTHDGVYYYNPVTKAKGQYFKNPADKNSLPENSLNALCEDSQGNIWCATEGGGLCKLHPDRKTFTRYTSRNGLPSNFVFKVLEDNDKILWISTAKGLVRFDPGAESMVVYSKENGVLNDQFNYNSGYKDAEGKLYFGSVKGMITFKPDAFYKSHFAPPVFLTGFQVHNRELKINKDSSLLKKSISYTNKITLPYDQSSFSIDFAAISFTSPETTEYAYIMDGLDKEWTYLKSNRKVYFTNLEPGSYTFKVKAGNKGNWGKEKKLTVLITPPFWATRWAYFIYAVVGLSLLYYLISLYHNMQENKKEKEIYEAKFEFFTNIAHEIKTPLTLIKGPVENLSELVNEMPEIKEDVVTMERNTNRLVNLINQFLDFRQTETKGFSLDFSNVNLNELLQEAYLTFEPLAKKRKLNYSMNLPSVNIHTMADAEALNKIFSNLFSNAVKYADKEVIVEMQAPKKEDDHLIIEFKNDGFIVPPELKEKIFEPFYRLKETVKQKGTGIGLALARSLVELHRGNLHMLDAAEGRNVFVLRLPYSTPDKKRKLEEAPALTIKPT